MLFYVQFSLFKDCLQLSIELNDRTMVNMITIWINICMHAVLV